MYADRVKAEGGEVREERESVLYGMYLDVFE
jgi:hypothetical protein